MTRVKRHLVSTADLARDDALLILDTAEEIATILDTAASFKEISERDIKKVPTLRGKTVINLFYESSTRTVSRRDVGRFLPT